MTEAKLRTYHCPRWEELPDLGLYLDQVLLVLEQALGPVTPSAEKGVITPTIINNYVKQKVLTPTQKKKYDRGQLADLVMILLLKRALSTVEIVRVLQAQKQDREPAAAYNAFCCELERRLNESVQPAAAPVTAAPCPPLVQAAVKALVGKILFEMLVEEADAQSSTAAARTPEKPDKKRARAEKAERAEKTAGTV